jgi:hypothetical protein
MSHSVRELDRKMRMETGINAVNSTAATINGDAIDRFGSAPRGGMSAALRVQCGSPTGSPSSFTVNAKLQDSADGTTDWQDIGSSITALTTANSGANAASINLNDKRRHIRAVVVVAFVSGTVPAIPVSATIAFGGRE